jgi:HAD superfamily hydrolase (TIGR01484 family)
MKNLPFSAIAFDVDDTLTESKQPLQEDMGLLLSELSSLVPVAIISGGKLEQLENQLVRRIPRANYTNLYLFPTGGASAFRFLHDGTRETIYENNLTAENLAEIFPVAQQVLDESKIIEGQKLYGDVIENRGSGVSISLLGQMTPPDIKRVFDPDQAKRKILQPILAKRLPNFEVKIGGMTTIDITQKGIDKAYGMRHFSEIVGIKEEDMVYVGDALYEGGNDAAILKTKMQIQKVTCRDDTLHYLTNILHA